jgi:hypothetical protein
MRSTSRPRSGSGSPSSAAPPAARACGVPALAHHQAEVVARAMDQGALLDVVAAAQRGPAQAATGAGERAAASAIRVSISR